MAAIILTARPDFEGIGRLYVNPSYYKTHARQSLIGAKIRYLWGLYPWLKRMAAYHLPASQAVVVCPTDHIIESIYYHLPISYKPDWAYPLQLDKFIHYHRIEGKSEDIYSCWVQWLRIAYRYLLES